MSHFFALINRTKYVNRWGLMRNTQNENLQEHSFQTAVLAHALCTIHNKECGGEVDPDRAAVLALYHDVTEIITGDLPTPIKYYNDDIKDSYKRIEQKASDALIEQLPEFLKDEYWGILNGEGTPEWRFVKAADTLSAYLKCMDELKAGNKEFSGAAIGLKSKLNAMDLPALDIFMDEFVDSFSLTLDEQSEDLL